MTLADLKKIIQDKYLHHGDYTLSSGAKSDKYFDIKSMMGDYNDMNELVNALWEFLERPMKFKSLGGLELGGVPLVTGLSVSYQMYDVSVCYIRKSQRIHGLKKMIEGQPKNPILLVDDVISTRVTVLEAIKTCYKENYEVCGVLCVINRSGHDIIHEPKWELLEWPIYSLFKESDFK